jgi:hypothetical protein
MKKPTLFEWVGNSETQIRPTPLGGGAPKSITKITEVADHGKDYYIIAAWFCKRVMMEP